MLVWLVAACRTEVPPNVAPAASPIDDAACFAEVAKTLSADDMDGRGTGTPGLEKARAYIEGRLSRLGLEPVATSEVPVLLGVTLGQGNALASGKSAYAVGSDWTPLGFSSTGSFAGDVVFAGYGIRAEEKGYDDLEGMDVRGKVVLALRYEPGESDEKSAFDGRRPTRWSDLRYKALRMREAGAAALVLVTGPLNADEGEQDGLPRLKPEGPTSVAGLPVLQVTREVAAAWMKAGKQDLAALQNQIDADVKPHSVALKGVRVEGRIDLQPTQVTSKNVLFALPGKGALAEESVVVGAHYDHLGHGGHGAMNPDVDAIHNGADDNASGVAGVVCAAERVVREASDADRRRIVFALFTAEEMGLGGSGWYVEHPSFPLESTVAMVNLDMVGRVRDDKLQAMGTDSSPSWAPLLQRLATAEGLTLATGGDGYGPSDHMSFYTHDIPVVHLFSGAHTDYHSPSDDFETLNVAGGAKVARLTAATALAVATEPRFAFVAGTSGSPMLGDSRGYGAYLGTIPDYTTMSEAKGGVLLSGVRDGSPAAVAGITNGDRIVGIGTYTIENLYDMTFALRDHKPGETVSVRVVRNGAPMDLRATLKSREERPGESRGPNPHAAAAWAPKAGKDVQALLDPRETHLADLRQLTFGGDNAEAYWSPDGRHLIFQATPPGAACDQEYVFDLDTGATTRVSSGKGRTTCGYYAWPKGERLLYATTERADAACPAPPDMSKGYTWAVHAGFDLVWQETGKDPVPFLASPGYDAEATACFLDGTIVFTSVRDGDLDLYTVNPDGSGLRRMTSTKGYDGGAFFTNDCKRIVWRASRPTGQELADYDTLLGQALVRPSKMELMVMNRDGTGVKQLTNNGAANFGPYPLPKDTGVLYASNVGASPREFDLWMVGFDGGEPAQVTYTPSFDGFPMFSPDQTWLVFASNRGGDGRETNLFVARWVP